MSALPLDPETFYKTTYAGWDADQRRDFMTRAVQNPNPEPAQVDQIEKPERFKVHDAADLFDNPPEDIEFLIDGLITKGSVNIVVGDPGSKKTWAMLDLAVCAALGKRWLDFPVKKTTVLVIDEESGKKRLGRRLYWAMRGHLADKGENFQIKYITLQRLDMGNPDDVNALTALILQHGAELVIMDPLVAIMPDRDENTVKDVQPIFLNLRSVADATDAAIVVIHHNNKAGGYRGSSAINGAIDLMLSVKATGKQYIEFKSEKTRDIESVSFSALATLQVEAGQFFLTRCEAGAGTTPAIGKGQKFVLRYLSVNPNGTVDEITGAADICSPATARSALYSLADGGYTERTDTGGMGKGVKAIYQLTDKGRELAERTQEGE